MTQSPTSYALAILSAMQPKAGRGGIYAGTVEPTEVSRRRAKNKAARRARRVGRR